MMCNKCGNICHDPCKLVPRDNPLKCQKSFHTKQQILKKFGISCLAMTLIILLALIVCSPFVTVDNSNATIEKPLLNDTRESLLNNEIFNQFNEALKERSTRGEYAEITFIGINSAIIKEHKKMGKILNVTVDFIAEVITCIKDKDKKIISGDPDKIKKIYDTWIFSRDLTSLNPNWQLINILT